MQQLRAIRAATYFEAQALDIPGGRSGERSRLKLLAAGARLLDTVSPEQLNVSSVCAEAGLSKGAFYIYFDTKDGFLLDLLEAYIQLEDQTFPRMPEEQSQYALVRAFVAWYESTFAVNVGLIRAMVRLEETSSEFQDVWHARNRRIVDRVIGEIGLPEKFSGLDPVLWRLSIRSVGSMMDQSLFARFGLPGGSGARHQVDEELLIDLHTLLIHRALFGANPSPDELPDALKGFVQATEHLEL